MTCRVCVCVCVYIYIYQIFIIKFSSMQLRSVSHSQQLFKYKIRSLVSGTEETILDCSCKPNIIPIAHIAITIGI